MANNTGIVSNPRGRPPKAVSEERMLLVVDMLMNLKTRSQIHQELYDRYGSGRKNTDYIITQAYKVIKESYLPDKEAIINQHINRYYEIANDAKDILDNKSQIAALQAIEKLLRMHQPDVAIQQNTLQLDLKDMSINDLKQLLSNE